MSAADSHFGPLRWDPNDLLRLRRDAEWRAVMEATGDAEPVTDTVVIHEPSARERGWVPPMHSPTNTVAMQMAPMIPKRNPFFTGLMFALGVSAGAAVVTALVLWATS
jgi:hypothetical protein